MARKTKYNNITTPELLENVNKNNKQLKKEFMDYLKSTQHSDGTIRGYSHDLDIFFVWNLQHNDNKDFVDVTKRNIVAYQNWLIYENENSPARVKRLKATLSSFSDFIENICDDEYPEFRAIVKKVASPVGAPVREKTVFTKEELNNLLSTLVEQGRFDQACFVSLGMNSGRRKAELLRFKVSYFDDSNLICGGALYKTPETVRTKGRGTNGKQLILYTLAKDFKPYFDMWMKRRKELGIESEWLFPREKNTSEHMLSSVVDGWSSKFTNICGKDWYVHSLRHYFTTALLDANIPSGIVQSIVGWTSADMVGLYDDRDAEDQFDKYFGPEGIKNDIQVNGLNGL